MLGSAWPLLQWLAVTKTPSAGHGMVVIIDERTDQAQQGRLFKRPYHRRAQGAQRCEHQGNLRPGGDL